MEDKVKERFLQLARKQGYQNLHQVSRATGIEQGNLLSNFGNKSDPSIKRLFIIANAIKVPVEDLLEIFYETQMQINRMACRKEIA